MFLERRRGRRQGRGREEEKSLLSLHRPRVSLHTHARSHAHTTAHIVTCTTHGSPYIQHINPGLLFLALRLSCPETTPEAKFQGGQSSLSGAFLQDATQKSQPSECPVCRAFENTVAAGQGPWEMLPSEQPPATHPQCCSVELQEVEVGRDNPGLPQRGFSGALGKITFEPVGCSMDGVFPQGLADPDDSATS